MLTLLLEHIGPSIRQADLKPKRGGALAAGGAEVEEAQRAQRQEKQRQEKLEDKLHRLRVLVHSRLPEVMRTIRGEGLQPQPQPQPQPQS